MNKLYAVFATEEDESGMERGLSFLVEAKTLPSAHKKAFRILKNEWDCADETEVVNGVIQFPNGPTIALSSIQIEETTAEKFAQQHIRIAP